MDSFTALPIWALELCLDLIENKPTLTSLKIVDIENEVAVTLANALCVNTTVKDVDIDLSFVHLDGIQALGEMLVTNKTIETIRMQTILNDIDGIHLPCEESCGGNESRYSRSGIAQGLLHNCTVKKIHLEGHGLDDAFWRAMRDRERNHAAGLLDELHITRAELPPTFQSFVASSSSLQTLSISSSVIYTDEVGCLDCNVASLAMRASAEHRDVSLSDVRLRGGAKKVHAAQHLSKFLHIRELSNNTLHVDQGCTADSAMALATNLQANTSIRNLRLPLNPIGGIGASFICNMLKGNHTLQVLDLSTTFIDNQIAANALGRALAENQSLIDLNLSGNCTINFSFQVACALYFNVSLRKLVLASTLVGDEGAMALAMALESNRTLRVLNVNDCQIGTDGGIALASSAVLQNDVLEELHLKGNSIGAMGTCALVTALKENKRLKVLVSDADANEDLSQQLAYWNRLTPCGRGILKENLNASLFARVLQRVSSDGGEDGLFSLLCERPDLIV